MFINNSVKYFNIHDLVKIKIETSLNHKLENILFQLREFEISSLTNQEIDIFIHDYSRCPKLPNPTVLSEYYFYENNFLNIPSLRFCFNLIDTPLVLYCDSFIIPINMLVELILLKRDYSFLHSAAVQYQGKNYILPSFGGVGKTTAIFAIIDHGGKIFGDDLVIIKGRNLLSYPIDFTIYPYHLKSLNIIKNKIIFQFKITEILDKITDFLGKYNYKIFKFITLILNHMKTPCLNIPPRDIFGDNCIIPNGVIDGVYFLSKVKNYDSKISIRPSDPINMAEMCTNILLQEWHGSMSILYTYSGLSEFSLNSLFIKIMQIFKNTFCNYKCHQMIIPYDLSNTNYREQIISNLNNL